MPAAGLAAAAAAAAFPPAPPAPPTGACNFTGWLTAGGAGTATPGAHLLTPIHELRTYLIDMQGQVVHHWFDDYVMGVKGYVEDDGTYVRIVCASGACAGGTGDGIRRVAWNGSLVWDYRMACAHHDAVTLPNRNVLILCSEAKTAAEVAAAGGPNSSRTVDSIVELRQSGATGAEVVWRWDVWDHIVQSADAAKPGYVQNASARPGRLDVGTGRAGGDWNHANSLDYNAGLDQVMVSFHSQSEIYIIDHSTTTAEAATSAGGRSGRGGDFLWRWGNPANYGHPASPQQLFLQHDAHWVTSDVASADPHTVLLFNNQNYTGAQQSTVPELRLPAPDPQTGVYPLTAGGVYAPAAPEWVWSRPGFYAGHISGAQRLGSGNTVVTNGETGEIVEVTPAGDAVWSFRYACADPWDCQFRSRRIPYAAPALAGRDLSAPVECNPAHAAA